MKQKTWILVGFILLKFVIQFNLISSQYDLQRDEYLYLDQAHHLAWGYLSVPPVTSWISYIIYLLGNSVFWIKFFPALFGALTLLTVWKAIEELKGDLFALILGAVSVLFSVLLGLNTLFQPNSLDVLCWTSLYFFIIKYFNTENTKWLYAAAVVFAFGFLNKYNILFLVLGLLPGILFTGQRRIFLKKELYLAVILGIVLILPNLLWQFNNGFPVVYHMKELSESQLVHVDRLGFLKSQALFFIGASFVIILALYALLVYKPYQQYRPFFWSFIFTLLIFMYFRAKNYYAIGLYPIYLSFGAVYIANLLKESWKIYLRPVAIAIPIIVFLPVFTFGFPNKSPEYIIEHSEVYKKFGLLRWEDGKDHEIPQDYADMLGWKELARKVDSVFVKLPNANQTIVLCDNYGQAGAINFYTKQNIKAESLNADYINWFNLDKQYVNLIRIKEYNENDSEFKEITPYFDLAVVSDSITNPYAREYKTTIYTFIGAKTDINKRISQEIQEVKNSTYWK